MQAVCSSDDAVDEMFGGGRKPIMAGMLGPGGTCEEVEGGYRGNGKYKFGSGSLHADWLGAGCLVAGALTGAAAGLLLAPLVFCGSPGSDKECEVNVRLILVLPAAAGVTDAVFFAMVNTAVGEVTS